MIPKIIHYCWFGGNPLPKLAEKCIKSWKKYCPNFRLMRWDESTFDVSKAPLYVRQAYEAKKWAFVSDYVRLWAMTRFGGVYMDTDVELVKPLDAFLRHEAFSGFEDVERIPTGIMGCRKDFPLFQKFLHYYDDISFWHEDGTMDTTTNVAIMTDICEAIGLEKNNQYQVLEGFVLYPKDVFCPLSYETGMLERTKNTVAIHWFSASWHSEEQRKKHKRTIAERKKQFRKDYWIHMPNRILIGILGRQRYENLKRKIGRG